MSASITYDRRPEGGYYAKNNGLIVGVVENISFPPSRTKSWSWFTLSDNDHGFATRQDAVNAMLRSEARRLAATR